MSKIEALRVEATKLVKKDPANNVSLRSCWKCNPAHEHLKRVRYVIVCFSCGHYYYKGRDITILNESLAKKEKDNSLGKSS